MKLVWIALYVASVLAANLTLDQFISLPVFGMLSLGTVFFAFVFTLRDRLHSFGMPTVIVAIAAAVVVNAWVAWYLGTPPRFLLASFVAILASELADTVVFQRLMSRSWLSRALSSNAVSVPIDSVLFTLIAFWGLMSQGEIIEIVFADILFKSLIAGLLALGINRWVYQPKQLALAP